MSSRNRFMPWFLSATILLAVALVGCPNGFDFTGHHSGPAPVVTFEDVAPSLFVLDPPWNYDLVDQYVYLTWPGPASGLSYTVIRSTDPDFADPEGTDVTLLDASGTGYVNGFFYDEYAAGYDFWDHAALLGQTYYYKVFAIDEASGAVSPPSVVVTAGAPAPKNVEAVENDDGGVTISWDAVTDALDYAIICARSDGLYVNQYQTHKPTTSLTLTIPEYVFEEITYYFFVQAFISDWGYFSLSNPLTYAAP